MRDQLNNLKLYERESYNDVLERLMEDMQKLNDKTKREIANSLKEIESGNFKTHKEVRKGLEF